jgi:hypothetical protein
VGGLRQAEPYLLDGERVASVGCVAVFAIANMGQDVASGLPRWSVETALLGFPFEQVGEHPAHGVMLDDEFVGCVGRQRLRFMPSPQPAVSLDTITPIGHGFDRFAVQKSLITFVVDPPVVAHGPRIR